MALDRAHSAGAWRLCDELKQPAYSPGGGVAQKDKMGKYLALRHNLYPGRCELGIGAEEQLAQSPSIEPLREYLSFRFTGLWRGERTHAHDVRAVCGAAGITEAHPTQPEYHQDEP